MGSDDRSLKERAEEKLKTNPSALGDPISLKAETSSHIPTEEEKGAGSDQAQKPKSQEENPSMLGDHTSLEKERTEPGKRKDSKL